MHFPPVSDFPLFSKNFQTLWKILKILPFPEKFLDFHPPKFLMTFFEFPTSFPCFSTFPPVSRSLIFPLLLKIPALFEKNSLAFYILYVYFVSPLL